MNTTLTNAEVLRTVTPVNHLIDGFKPWLKSWPEKHAGPKPTEAMFTVALAFGKLRKPGPESGFVAMQLRDGGASVAELAAAFNSGPAHNHSRALSADNKGQGAHLFTRTKGNGRFWLTFTVKGQNALTKVMAGFSAELAAGNATEAPPDKPKAAKGAKGAAAAKPASEAPKAAKAAKKAKAKKAKGPKQHEATSDAALNPDTLAAINAEISERNENLGTDTPKVENPTSEAPSVTEGHTDQQ